MIPTALKQQALEQTHVQLGHLGIEKTLAKVQDLYYWQNMKVDVIMYVRNCLTCQQYKGTAGLQQQWQELPPVEKPLERVCLDLTDMVAGAQEYRYVLIICDHYSRYENFYPLKGLPNNWEAKKWTTNPIFFFFFFFFADLNSKNI